MRAVAEANSIWLKWAYRYSTLEVDDFNSLEEAVTAGHYASEAGTEALQCYEGPDGIVDTALVAAIEEQLEAQEDHGSVAPKPTHKVVLSAPFDTDRYGSRTVGVVEWAYSAAEAERKARPYREQFGNRAHVVEIRSGDAT